MQLVAPAQPKVKALASEVEQLRLERYKKYHPLTFNGLSTDYAQGFLEECHRILHTMDVAEMSGLFLLHSSPPTSLLKFLSDNKNIVVGIGIEDVAKKLENDFNIKISKWVDLRIEARKKGYGQIANNCSVVTLAKKVLGDEWDVKEPTNMNWWANADYRLQDFLSDEKVKFGSLETFLAYRIGTKLLKD
ncbi:uncharacterized protein [Nicotiana tomentosiformis]|uniref:uncharacterized protein n=1 Tax=Nicotiana tomentosiformis TaxID=4098 RepID=UPI00388C8386